MSDENLRAAWATLPSSGQSPACAPSERIWQAVQGQLGEAEVRSMLEHSAACADCASLWRLAREFSALSSAREGTSIARPSLLALSRSRWAAGAGALLAAAALVVFLLPKQTEHHPAPTFRGTGEGGLRQVPGDDVLHRAHPVLRWTGAPEGSRYTVTVSTTDLTVLYKTSGLSTPELELPGDTLSGLPAGTEVFWRVEANLPQGQRLSSAAFVSKVE